MTPDRRPLVLRELRWMRTFAARLARRGVSPDSISMLGLACALIASVAWALTAGHSWSDRLLWIGGIACVALRILANTLDGLVALEGGRGSAAGMLYNEAPDRIADTALLIAAGYAYGGAPQLGYLAACVALFVSYVRILGRLAGAASDYRGPMDKGGRMLTLMAAALYAGLTPEAWQIEWGPNGSWGVAAIALAFIVLGGVFTAARRLRSAAAQLRRQG